MVALHGRLWWSRTVLAAIGAASIASLSVGGTPAVLAAAGTSASAPPAAQTPASGSGAAASGGGASIPPPAAGTETVADDGTLRLDMNMQTGWFEVVDERNGAVFTSGVQSQTQAHQYAVNPTQAAFLQSQFDMGRTTVERLSEQEFNNQFDQSNDLAQFSAQQIPNGVAMTYNYTGDGIEFTADLVLQGDHLVATVPYSQIFEQQYKGTKEMPIGQGGCPRFPQPPPKMSLQLFYFPPECITLTSITFLPAFGFGTPGQQGYLVVPDGSGATVDFQAVHPVYTTEFEMPVYGDPTVTPLDDQWLPEANMPVYGIVHTDAQDQSQSEGMLAVVTEGAANAEIFAVPAGQRAQVYKAYVKFNYRPQYNALGVGLQQSLEYSWHPESGDRQVTYYFLPGQNATYAGLALKYRDYLVSSQHAQPLPTQKTPPLLLAVMAGIREMGVPFAPFMRATTFAQAEQMVKDLQQQGVQSVRLSLEGWMRNGWDWTSLPYIWPPDGRLGGTGGLKQLAEWGRGHRAQVVLATNIYMAYRPGDGFNPRADAIHEESQLFLQNFDNSFLISPDFAEKQMYPSLMKDMARVGVQGTDFDYLARDVYPNYQPQHVLNRDQAAAAWMGMVSSARGHLGTSGVQGGNTYAVGSTDYFYDAPTADSGFNYESAAIPFWEIAVHGLALYSGRESNLRSSPQLQELQMIEDGALPSWELTWQPASVMRYTQDNYLYSSQFSEWEPQVVQEYQQEVQRGYARLAYVPITNNYVLMPGVHVTDYQDGSHVIVNYNSAPVTLAQFGNVTVAAQDYAVIPGGGGQ